MRQGLGMAYAWGSGFFTALGVVTLLHWGVVREVWLFLFWALCMAWLAWREGRTWSREGLGERRNTP